ncbi:MAG: chemotaxis response regulator protein-glutamate methylesterase [bacterium]|nr:chemotaxis response regulator protein-glutamate methylesterase [bacterium]
MNKKIRVVIADDSALMRKKISEILQSDPEIEVVAIAKDGKEAIDAIHDQKPDVVTLDVEMPVLNGLDTLGYIMSECPVPCVMISAFTKEGSEETIRALEFGAIDFICKPGGVISPDITKISKEIIEKVKLASKVPIEKLKLIWAEKAKESREIIKKPSSIIKVFAIASSTGGAQALSTILPLLSADLPAAVLVVQHMPVGFTKSFSERLNWQSKISILEAQDQMPIKPAQVIIARGGIHMEVEGGENNPHVILSDKPAQLGVKPCANIMMGSVAKNFKQKTVGIILTGMGTDGTFGAQAIKTAGGMVLAEDKSSCIVYGMPRSVVEAGLADRIVPLHLMAREMEKLVKV